MVSKFDEMVNAVYSYVNEADSSDECLNCLNNALEFMIRLRHSYVDNDKPKTNLEINEELLKRADLVGLRVGYVRIGDRLVDVKER